MSGGYIEDFGKVHGCFSCGEVMGDYAFNLEGWAICDHCGEPTVITMETALDTMIKLQREGHAFTSDYYGDDDLDSEIEFLEFELDDDEGVGG